MKLRFGNVTRWMVAIPALAAVVFSAGAQDTKTTSAANADAAAKVAQPANRAEPPWVDASKYVIGENDVLEIDVWKEKEISRTVPVRPDGKISLPLVGEVQASGMTPMALQDDLTKRLKAYIENPEVTVIVSDPRSHQFNVVGEVMRPGSYPLSQAMTVLDAIAQSGGFKDFAKETKIYVLRPVAGGARVRIPFNYKRVIQGRDLQENVALKPGDTIVVP
ncbi:MAG TPA: polysaccharide biosynthesis/export family protein [Candidatus Acidoferrales bacterium]|nr:polysaccharide biosynthesis/export family protein [Candidatus Acidoferrales bacterium]